MPGQQAGTDDAHHLHSPSGLAGASSGRSSAPAATTARSSGLRSSSSSLQELATATLGLFGGGKNGKSTRTSAEMSEGGLAAEQTPEKKKKVLLAEIQTFLTSHDQVCKWA